MHILSTVDRSTVDNSENNVLSMVDRLTVDISDNDNVLSMVDSSRSDDNNVLSTVDRSTECLLLFIEKSDNSDYDNVLSMILLVLIIVNFRLGPLTFYFLTIIVNC